MTDEAATELTDEERIEQILADNPFYDDRVDVLLNCLAGELTELGLPDERARELYRELETTLHKYEAMLPDPEKSN